MPTYCAGWAAAVGEDADPDIPIYWQAKTEYATAITARLAREMLLSHDIAQRGAKRMSKAIENLEAAQRKAMAIRPKVAGFPYLAETLRQAGVRRNIWSLPSAQSLFITNEGTVVTQGTPLMSGTVDAPSFDREALIAALRTDQAGNSTFLEFLAASWRAGVVRYDVDFSARTVSYYGCNGEEYVEKYPVVEVG
jgi:uncharacterized protein YbcV (DUF1398 family)